MVGSSGSIFQPASPEAQAITHLFVITLWICAVIFAIVAGIVGYSLVKYRWREGERDPVQLHGNKQVEIAWTVIPFLIVLLLFGLTVHAMTTSDPPLVGKPDLVVIGHQWWWEIRDPVHGFTTANEIHIPVGRQVSVQLDAVDVLHEFWVPRLTRKMITVPGAGNHVWMEADRAGTYQGVCSEFCGTQHAWMRFQVIADRPEDYAVWVRAQQAAALKPKEGDAAKGEALFRSLTCINCHTVRGVDAGGTAGPDLTHFATRAQFGSGIADNTPQNVRRWLENPQLIKFGAKMPNFKLKPDQVDDLLAYIETLQ